MTDKFKLLNKIRQGKKNVRTAELRRLMTQFGFNGVHTRHRVMYKHLKYPIKASVVEHREGKQERKVLECYVKNCLNAIDELLAREGSDEK